MRGLIATLFVLAGCGESSRVAVTFDVPDGAPSLAGALIRVTVGRDVDGDFQTLAGEGGPLGVEPLVFDLAAPAGSNRRVRALIRDPAGRPLLHGQSNLFELSAGGSTPVDVALHLPPEGHILKLRRTGATATLEMDARRWSKVQLGLLPGRPTHEAARPREGEEIDRLESFAVEYPLDQVDCTIGRCPIMLFADFLSADGVLGPTETASLTVDLDAPVLSTRARLEGASRLGPGGTLVVEVEANEAVSMPELRLARSLERAGHCPSTLGPYPCTGGGSTFSCRAESATLGCDGSYTVGVTAEDRAGNLGQATGAEIGVDTIPPQLTVMSVVCSSSSAVVAGVSVEATRVSLQDQAGAELAWTEGGSFVLAASSSTARAVAAIDGGGNEAALSIACP